MCAAFVPDGQGTPLFRGGGPLRAAQIQGGDDGVALAFGGGARVRVAVLVFRVGFGQGHEQVFDQLPASSSVSPENSNRRSVVQR